MPEPEVIEVEAKKMGWTPKEDFKGDPERWIDAEKFVERGQNEIPIMRERYKKMSGTVDHLERKIETMNSTFAEFQKYHTKVSKKAYEKALEDLTEQQRTAVTDGDIASFEKAEKAKKELDIPVEPESPEKKEFDSWLVDNKWYKDDQELQEYAVSMSSYVQRKTGLPDGSRLYDAVKEEVALRFPDKFKNPNRDKPPAVIGEGEVPAKKGKKTFANLPKEAQDACNSFIKNIPGFTKDQYLAEYDWE